MNVIRILSPDIVNKIAAGEIIERPASVIRELTDNALDAQSQTIYVEVEKGGKAFLCVSDDGCGMSPDDLKMCALQHATSKLRTFDDLSSIRSFGFRGEALHAISIMSSLRIQSKTFGAEHGYNLCWQGNTASDLIPIACNTGTRVEVRNLFSEFPVRQKILGSDWFEFKKIRDVCLQKAIVTPEKEWRLSHNGKVNLHLFPQKNWFLRLKEIFGQMADSFLPVRLDSEQFELSGYVSPPNIFKTAKRHQLFFVNDRCVMISFLTRAVYDAYQSFLPVKMHPMFFFRLKISPSRLDINSHPDKKEVKIYDISDIYQQLFMVLKSSLLSNPQVPNVQVRGGIMLRQNSSSHSVSESFKKTNGLYNFEKSGTSIVNDKLCMQNHVMEKTSLRSLQETKISNFDCPKTSSPENLFVKEMEHNVRLKMIGVVFKTYIISEFGEYLILLDQHATHERIKYEQFKQDLEKTNCIASQKLLMPYVFAYGEYVELISDQGIKELLRFGFETEHFGEQELSIQGIPYFMSAEEDSKQALETLVVELFGSDNKQISLLFFLDRCLKMKACRSSIKSGDSPSEQELEFLLNELNKYPETFACPHGRPTAIKVHKHDLERFFLRRM